LFSRTRYRSERGREISPQGGNHAAFSNWCVTLCDRQVVASRSDAVKKAKRDMLSFF